MAGENQSRRVVALLLFLAVTIGVAVLVFHAKGFERGKSGDLFGKKINREAYLQLQAENVLLKKMLGQIAAKVVVLGDVSDAGGATGRLVWDRATQGGYLHAKNLPDTGGLYSLWIKDEDGEIFYVGLFTADANGELQSAFQAEKPVFKPRIFFIAKGTTNKVIILQGSL